MGIKSSKHYYTIMYALVQGGFWINFVFLNGYCSVYLLDRKVANYQIGLIVGFAGIIAACVQPVVAAWADRPKSPALKWIVVGVAGGAAILGALLLVCYNAPPLVSGVLFGLAFAVLHFLLPFINSLGTEMINQGVPMNWGVSRGFGSVFYVAASSAMGVIVTGCGVISIPVAIILGYSLLLIMVLIFPFRKDPNKQAAAAGIRQATEVEFVKKYPKFFILLIGMTCVYISHALFNTYLFQVIASKGGDSQSLGNTMSICAAVELPPLFLFSWMLKKVGSDKWLRLCTVVMALKAIGTYLVTTVGALYLVCLLQIAGWAIIAIAPVYYVNQVIGHEDAIKGQAYMGMTFTLGNVIASFTGGAIIDAGGVSRMLIFSAAVSVVGALLVVLFSDRIRRS